MTISINKFYLYKCLGYSFFDDLHDLDVWIYVGFNTIIQQLVRLGKHLVSAKTVCKHRSKLKVGQPPMSNTKVEHVDFFLDNKVWLINNIVANIFKTEPF